MAARITMDIADDELMEKVFVDLIAEDESGREEWASVAQEELPLTLIIYPRISGEPWIFELDAVIEALQRAKQRLLE